MGGIGIDVTDRVRTEEALRDAKARIESIFRSSPIGIGVVVNRIIKEANDRLCEMTGYLREELLEKSALMLYPTVEEYERAGLAKYNMISERGTGNVETHWQRKNGSVIDILLSSSPIVPGDLSGEITFTAWDITERKKAEEAIKESETKFRSVLDSSKDLIYRLNLKTGRFEYLSPAIYGIFGFTPQEWAMNDAKTAAKWIHPDYAEVVADGFEKAQKDGKSEIEYRFRKKNGEYIWIHNSISVVNDSEGKPLYRDGVVRDITERKNYEEALKKVNEKLEEKVKERTVELENSYYALKESEESLAEAQEIAHIGNWSRNIITGEVQWSDEVYRIFGLNPQEFGVTYNIFLSYVHPEDRDFVLSVNKEVFEMKLLEVDYRIIRNDGVERILYEVIKAVFDEENNPIRLKGTVQDITERKKAEEALEKFDVVRKQEIHHRIKNNLQVISSLLDLQAEKFRNQEDIKDSEVLEAFRESQDRVISMALIHEELYKGGKIDTLNFSPYIKELAENLYQTYTLENKNISLSMDFEENIFFDMDIAIPLGMVINELVSNSFKYAFQGRDKGKIRISLLRDENRKSKNKGYISNAYILSVSDNGVGIPEDIDIENLDSLGLQLVTSLVDQLDGELGIIRRNGTETTVKFTVKEEYNQE